MACSYKYQNKLYTYSEIIDLIKNKKLQSVTSDSFSAKQWLVDNLGMSDTEISIVNGLIDGNALGRFIEDGRIILSDVASEDVAYHEAFHRVFRMYISPDERRTYYENFKKKKGYTEVLSLLKVDYPTLSENDLIEEALAEEFRDYVLSKRNTNPANKSLFDKILDFINSIIDKFTGKDSLDIYDVYNKILEGGYKKAEVLPEYLRKRGSADKRIEFKLGNEVISIPEKHTNAFMDSLTYNILSRLVQNNKGISFLFTEKFSSQANAIYEFGIKQLVAQLNINSRNESIPMKDRINIAALAAVANSNPSLIIKRHKENLAKYRIELELSKATEVNDTTVVNEPTSDEEMSTEGKRDIANYKSSFLYDPFDSASANVKLLLASIPKSTPNILGLTQGIDVAKTYNFLAKNLAGYPAEINIYLEHIDNNLVRVVPELSELKNRLGGFDQDLNFALSKSEDVGVRESFDRLIKMRNEFVQALAKTNNEFKVTLQKKNDAGQNIITSSNANLLQTSKILMDKWNSSFLNLYNSGNNKNSLIPIMTSVSDKNIFATSLGITLRPEDLSNSVIIGELDKIRKTINEKLKTFTETEKVSALASIYSKKGRFSQKSYDIYGFLNTIANEVAKTTTEVNLQHFNADNELVYGLTLNTFFSRVADTANIYKGNKAKLQEYLPHIFNVYTTNSKILEMVLAGNSLKVGILDGTSSEVADESLKTSKQGKSARLVQYINETLSGNFQFMQTSDREVTNYFTFGNGALFHKDVNPATWLPMYINYLKDEISTVRALDNLSITVNNLSKNGSQLQFFQGIKLDKNDLELIEASNIGDILNSTYANTIQKFVQDKFNETFNRFKVILNFYGNLAISEDHLLNYGNIDNAIMIAVMNMYTANIEQSKFFYGNLNGFKNAAENFKRFGMFNSTKKVSIVTKALNNYIQIKNSQSPIKLNGKQFIYKNNKIDGTFTELVITDDADKVSLNDSSLYQLKNIYKNFLEKRLNLKDNELENRLNILISPYTSMSEADGFSWINIYAYRELMMRAGDWTVSGKNSHEAVFNKIVNGEDITPDDLYRFTFLKPQYVGPLIYTNNFNDLTAEERLFIQAGRKTSYMPLIPQIIKDSNLKKVSDFMLESGIDVIHFDSASKYGARIKEDGRPFELYTKEGQLNITNQANNYTSKLDLRFLGLQVNMPNETKTNVTASTQDRKNNLHNRFNNGVPVDIDLNIDEWNTLTEDDKKAKSRIYSLVSRYVDLNNQIIEEKTNSLLIKLGAIKMGDNYKITDMNALKELVEESILTNPTDDAALDTIRYFFESGEYIESIHKSDKLKNVLAAIVQNKLISIKRTGTSIPQGSVKGFEPNTRTYSKNKLQASDELLFYSTLNPTSEEEKLLPMQVMIPLPKHLFNYVNSLSDTFEKGLDIFNKRVLDLNSKYYGGEFLNEDDEELRKIITMKALRIPNQGLASSEIMMVKQFHHPMAQGVIVPTALVAKSGGDFDIDKLVIYYANTKTINNKLLYDNNNLENQLLEVEQDLILDSNDINQYQFLSPTDDSILKNIVKNIEKLTSINTLYSTNIVPDEKNNSDVFRPEINLQKFIDFYAGSAGIGQVAVHITQHATAQQMGQKILNPSYRLYFPDNGGSVGGLYTQPLGNNKYLITEVLNALLTSQVDIGKDPYARKLGLNSMTMNVAIYMIRRGVSPELVFQFLAQPIIQDYIDINQRNESPFIKGVKEKTRKKAELIQEILEKYQLPNTLDFDTETNSSKFVNNYPELTISELSAGLSGEVKKEGNRSLKEIQKQIFDNFLFYNEQSKNFQKFIRTASPDTSGEKTFDEVEATNKELSEVIESRVVSNMENDEYFEKTLLKSFKVARDLKFKLFSPLSFNQKFIPLKEFALELAANVKGNKLKEKAFREVSNDFATFVVQNFHPKKFNQEEYEKLSKGENSVANRITAIKKNRNHPLFTNEALDIIVPLIGNQELIINDKKIVIDNLIPSFKSLPVPDMNKYQDEFAVIKTVDPTLYNDIIRYNLYQSGFSMSAYNLINLFNLDLTTDFKIPAFKEAENKLTQEHLENFFDNFISQNPRYGAKHFYAESDYKYYYDKNINSYVLKSPRGTLTPKKNSIYLKDYFSIPIVINDKGILTREDDYTSLDELTTQQIPTQEVVDSGIGKTLEDRVKKPSVSLSLPSIEAIMQKEGVIPMSDVKFILGVTPPQSGKASFAQISTLKKKMSAKNNQWLREGVKKTISFVEEPQKVGQADWYTYKVQLTNTEIDIDAKIERAQMRKDQTKVLELENIREQRNQSSTQKSKEDVSFVFESNPELASIGTQQQYLQYLSTIFPNSKVKDIVYRADKRTNLTAQTTVDDYTQIYVNGVYYTTKLDYVNNYNKILKGKIYPTILNIVNPAEIKTKQDIERLGRNKTEFERINKLKYSTNPKDSLIFDNSIYKTNDKYGEIGKEIVVFEPEQIHILGSKQDIQGFKEFVDNKDEVKTIESKYPQLPSGFNGEQLKLFIDDVLPEVDTNC